MSGIETIVKYSCLSDENRWDANKYNFTWASELSKNDKDIIELLDCLSDGEHSGQASSVQFVELMVREMDNGYPQELANDWSEIYAYINIITYEEFRHGLSLGVLYNYIKNNNFNYFKNESISEYGRKYLWCYKEREYWDLYEYLLTHLFSEITNTELYRDLSKQVKHPKLKELITNIMTDEARHMSAWSEVIKNLIHQNKYHKERMLKSLKKGINYHNAMVHERYFEGVNKMMHLFNPEGIKKQPAINIMLKNKYRMLNYLFGEENPLTIDDLYKEHMTFLSRSLGKKRASYDKKATDDILFATG